MAAGLQTWDAGAALIVDTSTIMGRVIEVQNSNTGSGSMNNASFGTGTPFAIPITDFSAISGYGLGSSMGLPIFSFSTSSVSWSRSAPSGEGLPPCVIYGGVF